MNTVRADATLANLCQNAAVEFVRQVRAGEDPRSFRIDLKRKIDVPDKALTTLGRDHCVRVRIRVTCESLIFERPEAGTASIVIPPHES